MLNRLQSVLVVLGLLLIIAGLVTKPGAFTPLLSGLLMILAAAANVIYIALQAELRGRGDRRQKNA